MLRKVGATWGQARILGAMAPMPPPETPSVGSYRKRRIWRSRRAARRLAAADYERTTQRRRRWRWSVACRAAVAWRTTDWASTSRRRPADGSGSVPRHRWRQLHTSSSAGRGQHRLPCAPLASPWYRLDHLQWRHESAEREKRCLCKEGRKEKKDWNKYVGHP